MDTSQDVNTLRGDARPPSIGLTSSVLPEAKASHDRVCSYTGVSTRNAPTQTEHWYALRTTYGREKMAYDFIISHGGTAFLPTVVKEKEINGKKKLVEVSRIPNIFFAYGTEEAVKAFVYDNHNLPFLRFYYKHTHVGSRIEKSPLIVPNREMQTLQIICGVENTDHVFVLEEEVTKFQTGERVRVIEGNFKGVEGVVARYRGQQRVGIVIEGLLSAVTAFIPTAFLEKS